MDHVSQVGLCYRADPPTRPGGTDQSILRALSDLMPVIADQSRWDDQNSKIETGHLFSIVKLNFNVGFFSCIF